MRAVYTCLMSTLGRPVGEPSPLVAPRGGSPVSLLNNEVVLASKH
jgi:hypothetical protein